MHDICNRHLRIPLNASWLDANQDALWGIHKCIPHNASWLDANIFVLELKGIISDSLRLRKIFKPFRNTEKYLSITICTIFPQKNHINLTEKQLEKLWKIKIQMICYWKHRLELIIAGENNSKQTKNCLSFQKYTVSKRVVVPSKLLQWSSLWICKQNLGVWKKSEVWNWQLLQSI